MARTTSRPGYTKCGFESVGVSRGVCEIHMYVMLTRVNDGTECDY